MNVRLWAKTLERLAYMAVLRATQCREAWRSLLTHPAHDIELNSLVVLRRHVKRGLEMCRTFYRSLSSWDFPCRILCSTYVQFPQPNQAVTQAYTRSAPEGNLLYTTRHKVAENFLSVEEQAYFADPVGFPNEERREGERQ